MNESCSSLRVLLKHLGVLMVAGRSELYILLNCCRCQHEAELTVFFLSRPELTYLQTAHRDMKASIDLFCSQNNLQCKG